MPKPPLDPSQQVLRWARGASRHHQVYLVMRDRIRSGFWRAGDLLPAEDDIARSFGVSRVTVRTAMASLERDRLVDRRQGIGTFAQRAPTATTPLRASMSELKAHMREISARTAVRVLEFSYGAAPPALYASLDCGPEDVFQRVVRLRSTADAPLLHLTTLIPAHVGKRFEREDLERKSLNELLIRAGVRLATGTQVCSAVLADPVVAGRLAIDVGAALLQIRRIHYDAGDRAVEYIEVLASPTQFELNMTLSDDDL